MKRVQLEIALGTILVFLSSAILIVMGINEPQRMAEYERTQKAEQIEFGAAVYEINCTGCHGKYAEGTALAPCLRCEELFTTRLADVGWDGSLTDYVVSVVTTGRQVSTRPGLYIGGGKPAMPTWSDKLGGPLRDDQIKAVAAFIANFEEWALNPSLVPTPLSVVDSSDPVVLGKIVFSKNCSACHTVTGFSTGVIGPVLDGIATRAGETVSGYSAEEYIRESVTAPGAFVVTGFADGLMPQNFSETLSEEDFENLIIFLLTLEE